MKRKYSLARTRRLGLLMTACPLSASTRSRTLEDAKARYARRGQEYTDEQIATHLETHSVLHLLDTVPVEKIQSVRWHIDCGDDDFLIDGRRR